MASSNIGVYVRIRPPSKSESRDSPHTPHLQVKDKEVRIKHSHGNKLKLYSFSGIHHNSSNQEEFYNLCGINTLVDRVLEGYHSTIFAYGQTGSGKTYTMQGFEYTPEQNPKALCNVSEKNSNLGIIPRSLRYLFKQIETRPDRSFRTEVSFLQVYNQQIYDLLNVEARGKQKGLKLRWNKHEQFVVDKLESHPCGDLDKALEIYCEGVKNKIMCRHKLNMASSRSHCILILKVESCSHEDPTNVLRSKFCFVDLAGSERQEATGTEGHNFKEAIEINKSLFTLRQVIMTLAESSRSSNVDTPKEEWHIPYRDSKLTSILKQSLGGDSYCVMVACLSPGESHLEESTQTLSYAALASEIANAPVINEDLRVRQIRRLQTELERVNSDLNKANEHIRTLTLLLETKQIQESKESRFSSEPSQTLYEFKSKESQMSRDSKESSIVDEPDDPTTPKTNKEALSRQPLISSPEVSEQLVTEPIRKERENIRKERENGFKRNTFIRKNEISKNKQFAELTGMIKDLLQANILLRENGAEAIKTLAQKERQLHLVMNENQVLRGRWDMVGGFTAQLHPQTHNEPQADFYRLEELIGEESRLLHKPYRVHTPSRHSNKNFSIVASKELFLQDKSKDDRYSKEEGKYSKEEGYSKEGKYTRKNLKSLYQKL